MAASSAEDGMLGNRSLDRFDVCVIGSGAGGGAAAYALTAGGKNVLVLECGHNPWPGLDGPNLPLPRHSNDELKYALREYIEPLSRLEPRTFRQRASDTAAIHDDVNLLPRAVGGSFQHADCKVPRYNAFDFELKSRLEALLGATPGLAIPGFGSDAASANFADWPFSYADLEPHYAEMELLHGVQGADDNPFASWRSSPFPMPPGVAMYFALVIAEGARQASLQGRLLTPHTYPGAHNTKFYDERPPCVDCDWCSGFGCPNNSKGSPAVTTLRKALLSGRCQLRYNAKAVRLLNDGGHVSAVEYVDGAGVNRIATADAFVLAASPIESARLCLMSPTPSGETLGDSSGQVGRNLMFHLQTNVSGFLPQRVHGQRGRAVTHGLTDFRGLEPGGDVPRIFDVNGAPGVRLGGIVEFSASQGLPITDDGGVAAFQLPGKSGARFGTKLKNALRDGALTQHLVSVLMQAEDAPQLTNRVDLDPSVRDVFGLPVARVTYASHPFELGVRNFYIPYQRQILELAGATRIFTVPCDTLLGDPPTSHHEMGTLRMGPDAATSVTNPEGRFHDVDNLYACDGSVFPTASGYNPTCTVIAVALKIAHGMAPSPLPVA